MEHAGKLAFILCISVLLFGCSGSGCSSDSQCKGGETCKSGSCAQCSAETYSCDNSTPCCSGMACIEGACRVLNAAVQGQNQTDSQAGNQTSTMNASSVAGNETSQANLSIQLNRTSEPWLNSSPISSPTLLDLPEGRSAAAGGLLITPFKISETMNGCAPENETLVLQVKGAGKTSEFTLREGEGADLGSASLKVINLISTVSNEVGCAGGNPMATFEIIRKPHAETILSRGDRVSAPSGTMLFQLTGISDLGPFSEYSREIEVTQGEPAHFFYPYLGGVGYLDLKAESIDITASSAPVGSDCEILSKSVKLSGKSAGNNEVFASALEGQNTSVPLHSIFVEKISGELLPSSGSGCEAFNKSALLNITFPKSYGNLNATFLLTGDGDTKEIYADSQHPWSSGGVTLEVSPTGDSQSAGGTAISARLTGTDSGFAGLHTGENASYGGISVFLESFSPTAAESGGSCLLVGAKASVRVAQGAYSVRSVLSVGDSVPLPDGSYVKFSDSGQDFTRKVSSCEVYLRRAILMLTPPLQRKN